MKKIIRNALIAGTLCAFLAVSAFAGESGIRPILLGEMRPIPVSNTPVHWAEPSVKELAGKYDVEYIFSGKNLDDIVAAEDYQYLVKLISGQETYQVPEAITREAVVHEMTKIWAQKTGQDLEKIPVIKMLIYEDTAEIDSKYSHSATVAYMKKIAKGRGKRIFAPKMNVTYGELAALLNNTEKAVAAELGSGEEPAAEGRFETKGSYQIVDGKVIFDFELTNHYPETKQFKLGSGQQFEVVITDEAGKEVYRYSDGKFFTLALLLKNLNPGESLKWQDEWDMTNKDGEKLTTGKYKAQITILVITEEGEEKIAEDQLTAVIDFSLTESAGTVIQAEDLSEDGIIKPELAEQIIKDTAREVVQALKSKDTEKISQYVHPLKGVRFTPYTHVSPERDVVFSKDALKNFFTDRKVYLWGYFDGTGEEMRLTPSQYYEKFVYSEDFLHADKVGYNIVLSSGNMLENQFEVYENPIIVEYYFEGSPEYSGMDWKSLRLVFEQHEGSWQLTGIIHNQWTI